MRIIYMGNNIRGETCLKTLLDAGEEVIAVVAHPDVDSRSGELTVVGIAREKNIPVFQPVDVNDDKFVEKVIGMAPDLAVMAGYNQILEKKFINIPPKGCINLHGGKLPDYRGAAPLNWAMINGETLFGLSIIYVDEGIDSGDIINQREFMVTKKDTIADVLKKSLDIFPEMLMETLEEIKSGNVKRKKQDLSKGKYYPRRSPEDGLIKWACMTAEEIFNLIRALAPPYPCAFTFHNDRKLYCLQSEISNANTDSEPGQIVCVNAGGAVTATKCGNVLIRKILDDKREAIEIKNVFKTGDILR